MTLTHTAKLLLLILVVTLPGCTSRAISQEAPATPQVLTGESTTGTRKLAMKLTLSSPADLLVREGDHVGESQPIADRVRDRQRLTAQLEKLQLQIAQVSQAIPGAPPVRTVPDIAGLPPANLLSEVAEVERMKLIVQQAERNLSDQQRLLDMLTTLPNDQVPAAVIPHEQEVLTKRQEQLDQTRADLQLAEAKLTQAQSERQFEEYQHSITVTQRQLQIQQNELERQAQIQRQQQAEGDRTFQLAQLEAQRNQIEMQLFDLSTVRSPFNGKITRIRWDGQTDQNLIVELTLVADGGPSDAGGADPPTSPGAGR